VAVGASAAAVADGVVERVGADEILARRVGHAVTLFVAVPWAGLRDALHAEACRRPDRWSVGQHVDVTGVFLVVVAVSLAATGGRLGVALTVTVTFAVAVWPAVSLTV